MAKSNPFSHKIDYNAAIANDEACISLGEELRKLYPLITAEEKALPPGYLLLIHVVLASYKYPERMKHFGLTLADIAGVYFVMDLPLPSELAGVERVRYSEAEKIMKDIDLRFGGISGIPSPEKNEKFIKDAKASLARHKRNKAKYATV